MKVFSLSFILLVLMARVAGANEFQIIKSPANGQKVDASTDFLFIGATAKEIIQSLGVADVRQKVYETEPGRATIVRIYIGTHIICVQKTPEEDAKSTTCLMTINSKGEALDAKTYRADLIKQLLEGSSAK
jgi:hypothetical protein